MPRSLRPLATYPVSRVERVWRIDPFDARQAYSVRMASAVKLTVLENGTREVYATRIERDLPGRFLVNGRWLVYETYPRGAERLRRAELEYRAELARRQRAEIRIRGFVRRLTRELGSPRRAKACDRIHHAFRAPDDARCAEVIAEARRVGAAATLFLAPWARELRVTGGGPGSLAALFDWNVYGSDGLPTAIDKLDADAGLTFPYIADADWFAMQLERRPRRPAQHAAALAEHFNVSRQDLAAALRDRTLVVGPPASAWRRLWRAIQDPGTDTDDGED